MTPTSDLVRLIYQSNLEKDGFLELMTALTDEKTRSLDEDDFLLHFDQAAEISQRLGRLEQKNSTAESIFNQLKTGIVLLDANAKVVFINDNAQQLIDSSSCINIHQQYLKFESHDKNHQLHQCLQSLDRQQNVDLINFSLDINGKQRLAILSPIDSAADKPHGKIPDTAVATLFFSFNLTNNDAVRNKLKDLYQLTNAEADITCRLANGETIERIAQQRDCKATTIRSFTKSIYSKIGVNRQQQLITLVLQSPLQVPVDTHTGVPQFMDGIISSQGRQLSYRCYGPCDGTPAILFHSSLGCRLQSPLDVASLYSTNTRLIILERPSLGLSISAPYESITDAATDYQALLQHLNLKKSRIIGILAGGVFALAVAHECPEQVEEILLLESFAPNIEEYKISDAPIYYKVMPRLIQVFPRAGEKLMALVLQESNRDWDRVFTHVSKLFNNADSSVLIRPEIKYKAIAETIECLSSGVKGLAREISLVHNTWPIELKNIKTPVIIVYGNADNVSSAYAQKLLEELPNNRAIYREGEGFAAMLYLNFFEILQQAGWLEK